MKERGKLSLEVIRGRGLPGVGTAPGDGPVPLYTSAATGPEVTHYLVTALDEAIGLLRRAMPRPHRARKLPSMRTSDGSSYGQARPYRELAAGVTSSPFKDDEEVAR